ncbi:outer membrane protein assembly factor BamB family protein [Thalassoglobus neptunius]|uniref:outer membrane protein assembly factor BamB family protein n=1 Tax=Thalassoglobus neptunius TaxID=1938619 RepID=UPI0018D227E6|nr:PQQ-binding-like beta-propeller repeat protein [Thalassoglobus neptunius]
MAESFGQPPGDQKEQGDQNDEVEKLADEEDVNLSFSALIPRDRDVERLFGQVRSSIQSGEYASAAAVLASILQRDQSSIVLSNGVLKDSSSHALELLLSSSSEVIDSYRRISEPTAEVALNFAREHSDIFELRSVLIRFPQTAACEAAVREIASVMIDQGDEFAASTVLTEAVNSGRVSRDLTRINAAMIQRFGVASNDVLSGERGQDQNSDIPVPVISGPVWEVPLGYSQTVQDVERFGLRDLRENGLTPMASWRAVFAENLMVASIPSGLIAINTDDGSVVWAREAATFSARPFRDEPAGTRTQRSDTLVRSVMSRLFGESVFSHLLVDGESLYCVEATTLESSTSARGQDDEGRFQITSLDIQTGEENWVNRDLFTGLDYACSPPVVFGESVLVIVERSEESSFVLVSLDKNSGALQRSLTLCKPMRPIDLSAREGGAVHRKNDEDWRRQNLACPIVIRGTTAFCSTGAGALVAVNLANWNVDWMYRYPRSDIPSIGPDFYGPEFGLTGFQWWAGWQQVQILPSSEALILCSPESEMLHCLNLNSGELRWSRRRDDSLYVAEVSDGSGVVVIGKDSARSYDLEAGHVLWESSMEFPAGTGAVGGDFILAPDSSLGWIRLATRTGEKEASTLNWSAPLISKTHATAPRLRNFFRDGESLYEISFDRIAKFHSIESFKRGDAIPNERTPNEEVLLALELDGFDGLNAVLSDGLDALDPDSEALELLVQSLQKESIESTDADRRIAARDVLNSHSLPMSLRAACFATELTDTLQHRDWSQLESLLVETLSGELPTKGYWQSKNRRVRVDRWFVGQMLAAAHSLSADDRAELDQLMQAVVTKLQFDDPEQSRKLKRILARTPWLDLVDLESILERPVLEVSLEEELLQLELEKCSVDEVSSDQENDSSKTWPVRSPQKKIQALGRSLVNFLPMSVLDECERVVTDWNVWIDVPGHRGLQFSGSQWSRPWNAYLPPTVRGLRYEPGLVRAWALGKLLVLQVGSEVVGFSPFDSQGNPGSRQLWPPAGQTIDTLGDRSNHLLSFETHPVESTSGFPSPTEERLNEFGHQATSVGPVRPGYFCIQQKGMLVAFDPLTGEELWRRYDLPMRARCVGDDQWVIVRSPSSKRSQILSAIDGSQVGSKPLNPDRVTSLYGLGRFELQQREVASAEGDQLELRWMDLATEEPVWAKRFATTVIPFEFDRDRFGVLGEEGQVELIDVATGEVFSSESVEELAGRDVERIVCSVGRKDCLVVFSEAVSDPALVNAPQTRKGYRKELVNGIAILFDRQSGKPIWKRPLENTVFPIDQPVDLPVFVTAESRFPEEAMDQQSPMSRVCVYDRRSGELIHTEESLNPVPSCHLSGDLEAEVVVLRTRTSAVAFDYSEPAESNEATSSNSNTETSNE